MKDRRKAKTLWRIISLSLCLLLTLGSLPISAVECKIESEDVHTHEKAQVSTSPSLGAASSSTPSTGEGTTTECTCRKKCKDGAMDKSCPHCKKDGSTPDSCGGLPSWTEMNGTPITTWELLMNACRVVSAVGNYQCYIPLEADLLSDGTIITVPANCKIVLDLNGHNIGNGHTGFIKVYGELIVWDLAGGGSITGFSSPFTIMEGGYCRMEGGTLRDNRSGTLNAGSVLIQPTGTFEMIGGTILGNHQVLSFLSNNIDIAVAGTMIISGGAKIRCCSDPDCEEEYIEGAIRVSDGGKIIANGGEVRSYVKICDDTCSITSTVENGTSFKKAVESAGTISGGSFHGEIRNIDGGKITGGEFDGTVKNGSGCTISGGEFSGEVTSADGSSIIGGDFNATVNNEAGSTISGGIFNARVNHEGTISGGIFYGATPGGGTFEDSAYITVTLDTNGGDAMEPVKVVRGKRLASDIIPTREGYFFRYWEYGHDEYDFLTRLTEDITLKAIWWKHELLLISDYPLVEGVDYTYEDAILTIKTEKPITIRNSDPTKPSENVIVIAGGVAADITLDGLNIDVSSTGFVDPNDIEGFKIGRAAIAIDGGNADVRITLADGSVNTLKGGELCAAIQKSYHDSESTGSTGTLTICGNGSLDCTGGNGGAGIGGEDNASTRNIVITGGSITARGGENAAGIGGGFLGVAQNITISGGTVTAYGGSSSDETIAGGSGIGGGATNFTSTLKSSGIVISGGSVTSYGGQGADGIGGGSNGSITDISLLGGEIVSVGGEGKHAFGIAPTFVSYRTHSTFAGDSISTLADVSAPTSDTYTQSVAVKIFVEVVSLDITWTAMSFNYADYKWDPSTHSYISGGWTTSGGTLTLTNAGNVNVLAELSFTSTLDGVTGTLSNTSFALSPTESGTTALTLEGKPSAALDNARVGSINITISKNTGNE